MLLTWQAVFNISDNTITSLLLCLRHFMWLIGNIISSDVLSSFADMIPKTLHSLRKLTSIHRDNFCKYAVCPKCKMTYTLAECYQISRNGSVTSKTCGYIPFYKHPHKTSALRKKCGSLLMTKVTRFNGTESLYPKQTYCYKKVIQSLETLIRRPGFLEKCEKWRQRQIPDSVMADAYDGQIWADFQYVNGQPFLAEPNNFALMMNVDWYQPFKNSPYSVGVIYLAILNLPREERFKQENIILVGVIPGPKEPKNNINTYLDPLVDELRELWDGVPIFDSSFLGCQVYRAALLCLSSDIPASRKCGGFVGHGALRG